MTKSRSDVSRQFSTLTQQTKDDFDQKCDGSETSWVDAGGENSNSRMQIWAYRNSKPRLLLTYALSILTCGLVRLIFHWKPTWRIALTCYGCSLKEAELILIRDENFEYFLREVKFGGQTNVDGLSFFGPNGEIYDQEYYRYFNHKKISYVWYGERYRFRRLMNADHKIHCGEYHKFSPLTDKQADRRFAVYGPNEILVKLKPVAHLVFLEALNPFYVFQVFSISIWFSDNYYYYASVILIMSVLSIAVDVYQIRVNQKALRDTISSSGTVTLIRRISLMDPVRNSSNAGTSNDVETKNVVVCSTKLVPGDIIVIPNHGCVMQCDAILLNGNCIVNESMLTGESVPVTKTPIPKVESLEGATFYDDKHHAKHTLYNGTKILQTRYYSGQQVKALVIRTGYSTMKGHLVRSIMYPKPVDFEFTKDLLRFVGVLACIAGVGFLYTIVLMSMSGIGVTKIFLRAMDIITIVVPPALPAAMTIGVIAAEQRLKKKNIYCISPTTINTCGGLNVVCFDKTGTLTEEGLDLLGVLPCKSEIMCTEINSVTELSTGNPLVQTMACCHSLTRIENVLTGDPLDLVLFRETGWILEEPEVVEESDRYDMLAPTIVRPRYFQDEKLIFPSNVPVGDHSAPANLESFQGDNEDTCMEIGILRQLTFSSSLQRMSVVVRIFGSQKLTLYCKGAPETVVGLCLPETVPFEFHNILQRYTQKGYRVLAAASRTLDMSYVKSQRASRDQLERDLTFRGLIILENRLKPETTPVISQLSRADVRSIMVTGDNILTAVSVGRECGILHENKRLYVVEICDEVVLDPMAAEAPSAPVIKVKRDKFCSTISAPSLPQLERLNNGAKEFEGERQRRRSTSSRRNTDESLFIKCEDGFKLRYQLAITGTSFALLLKHYPHLVPQLVSVCDIFARMSPEQKALLVNYLQELGYVVAMCGDGANDCGALKAAHAGISLSDAEASIASPFTSKTPDIRCVLDIIREGRAALVTSFGVFKYMASYSMTQFLSVSVLYWIGTNLADFQFLYIDLCLITVFAIFFGYTPAANFIDPKPPPTKILSISSVTSICLQLIISIIFQLFNYFLVAQQPWFIPFVDPGDRESFDAYQGTAIFLSSINQYITLAIVYSKSYPYRKSLYSNRLLFCALILCFTLNVCITLTPPHFLAAWLDLKLFPFVRYRLLIVFLAILNFLLAIFAEKFLVEYVLQKFLSRRKLTNAKTVPEFEEILSEIGSSLSWLHRARPVSLTGDSFSDTPPPVVSVENGRLLENNNRNDLSTSSTIKMCPMSFSSPSDAETEKTDIETGNETNA